MRLPRLTLLALQLLPMHEMNTGRTTEATVIASCGLTSSVISSDAERSVPGWPRAGSVAIRNFAIFG